MNWLYYLSFGGNQSVCALEAFFFILMQRRRDRMSFSIFCKVTARTECPVVRHYDNNKLMTDESVFRSDNVRCYRGKFRAV